MICDNCKGKNIIVSPVFEIKIRYIEGIIFFFWSVLIFWTCGLALLIPAVRGKQILTNVHIVAVCQDCGNNWEIKKPLSSEDVARYNKPIDEINLNLRQLLRNLDSSIPKRGLQD